MPTYRMQVRVYCAPVTIEVEAETMKEAWADRDRLAREADIVPVITGLFPAHIETIPEKPPS